MAPSMALIFPWTVHIVNELSNNKVLHVHCKSADNDLGVHTLKPKAEFKFSFWENPWGTTLFWCTLSTDRQSRASFDVFWSSLWLSKGTKRNKYTDLEKVTKNEKILWIARNDGIYLRETNFKPESLNRIDPNEEDIIVEDVLFHKWERKK
ncbi:unnamed protein product [Dovyalis caffra]|uniref:S-protein homolog n=1 Tax=Dovyalis caffra TaxID=77055 RepID=A0AAV1R703_9ROSI|nr:unnamed protein product [Dovyalis caffra]